jgi:hypothetical protein
MQSIISWIAGDGHRFSHLRMHKVAMAPFAAAVKEPGLLKVFDQVPHFPGQLSSPVA